jgi:hypothetical protein
MGKRKGYWSTHPKPELQALLMLFHNANWRIVDPTSRYYKVYCSCGGHKATIHLSPSDPGYAMNRSKWLQRQSCYKEG